MQDQFLIYKLQFNLYLLATIIFVYYTVSKSKTPNPVIDFVTLVWFTTSSFYRSTYAWYFSKWMFRLKGGDKMFAFFLAAIFVIYAIFSIKKKYSLKLLIYEKYLYLYLTTAILIYYIHLSLDNIVEARVKIFVEIFVSALLIFHFFRYFVTKEFLSSFIKVILYVGIMTSISGFIQFFIDKGFMRVSHFNYAIPGHFRSSGLFREPASHGFFLIISLYTAYFAIKNYRLRTFLIIFFSLNIFLVFSRGVWLATIATVIMYMLYFHTNIKKRKILLGFTLGMLVVLIPFLFYMGSKELTESSEVASRVFEDTLSARMQYYSYTIKAIPERLFIGFGDTYENDHYFSGMVSLNLGLRWALGKSGGIHNLILEETYLRGVICTAFFIMFFLTFFLVNLNESLKTKSYIQLIPNFFVLAFFIYEFTVSGYLISYSGFMTVFYAAISAGIYHNKIDLSEFKFRNPEKIKRSE